MRATDQADGAPITTTSARARSQATSSDDLARDGLVADDRHDVEAPANERGGQFLAGVAGAHVQDGSPGDEGSQRRAPTRRVAATATPSSRSSCASWLVRR